MGQVTISEELQSQISAGESLHLEFKSDHKGNFNDDTIVKSVVAMANAEGGQILIGISDVGEIIGSKRLRENYWANEKAIEGVILQHTTPSHRVAVHIYTHNDHQVACISVPRARSVIGTKAGLFLIRRYDTKGRPANVPMTAEEVVGATTRFGAMDFSASTFNDLKIDSINLELAASRFSQMVRQSSDPKEIAVFDQDPVSVLKSIGLIEGANSPNVACLLLFGHGAAIRERLPSFYVQYQVFGETGQLFKNERYDTPIVAMVPILLELPDLKRNSDEFVLKGQAHVIPEYPEFVRREAFANALVHRDYTLPSGIQIQLYESELVVTSPGSFPPGVNDKNLLSVPPTPRNRRLAEAMTRLKLVESSGRGIDFIFRGQALYGRPAPDYSASDADRVCVRLAGGKANLAFCKFILSTVENPTVPEVLVLNALFLNRDQTLDELQNLTHSSPTVTEQLLYGMNKKGLIEMSEDKQRYFLKGSLHPLARKAVKPARLTQRQIESYKIQILKEIKRRGQIERDEIADILGLSLPQAYRLLDRLREEGKVEMFHKSWRLKDIRETN